MKKILLCGALVALLTACTTSSDVDTKPLRTVDAPTTVYAEFDDDVTRTYANEDLLLRWHEGDEISFFTVTYNLRYRFEGRTGDNSGSFRKMTTRLVTGNEIPTNYALYPYREDTKIMEDGEITFEASNVQTYAVNSFGRGDNVMIATTQDCNDNVLRFKNVGGYLKLQLFSEAMEVERIELRGNNDEPLAGACHIRGYYGGVPTVEMADGATSELMLDCWQSNRGGFPTLSTDKEQPTTFWFVLPPTTFENGFTVTIYDTAGNAYTKSTTKSIAIERNIVQPMSAFDPAATDDTPGEEEPLSVYNTSYNGYAVNINIPEEVKERGNALRYRSMSLHQYNAQKKQMSEVELLTYNAGLIATTDGVYSVSDNNPDPIVPGEPCVFFIGEFGHMAADEFLIYADNEVVSMYGSPDAYWNSYIWGNPFGSEGYYNPALDWLSWCQNGFASSIDEHFTGYFERILVETNRPSQLSGNTSILNVKGSDGSHYIELRPTDDVLGYFVLLVSEEEYINQILPSINNIESYMQWFTASYDAILNYGVAFTSGVSQINLSDRFSVGESVRVFVTSLGNSEGTLQSFNQATLIVGQ